MIRRNELENGYYLIESRTGDVEPFFVCIDSNFVHHNVPRSTMRRAIFEEDWDWRPMIPIGVPEQFPDYGSTILEPPFSD